MGHSYFSRMLMVSDFQQLKDVKGALSDETGIVYFYPKNQQFDNMYSAVNQIIANAENLDKSLNKDQQTEIILNLISQNGYRLEALETVHQKMPPATNRRLFAPIRYIRFLQQPQPHRSKDLNMTVYRRNRILPGII